MTRLAPHGGCNWSGCTICNPTNDDAELTATLEAQVGEVPDTGELAPGWSATDDPQVAISNVTYPDVHVELIGQDGNAFNLIGIVARALRSAVDAEAATRFQTEAMSQGSYDDLLALITRTVNVE